MSPRLLIPALALLALIVPSAASASNCDPIDPRNCLLPYPNDWFTKASKSTDTGRLLALQRGDCRRTPTASTSTRPT